MIRQPLAVEHRVPVAHLKVQMRSTRISGVPEKPYNVSPPHSVARSDTRPPWVEVAINHEMATANIEDYMVASQSLQCHRYGVGAQARNIIRNIVPCPDDSAISDRQHFRAVAVVVLI
jgi:hypothetical protein